MDLSEQLALWADQLRGIANNGSQFVKNPYDAANYEQIRRIAAEMFGLAAGRPTEELTPRLQLLLGHYTPMVMGDALVINQEGEILLIQRADSGLWGSPGGAYDVGETAAEGVIRECREETGWHVEPYALIGVYDSRLVGTMEGQHVYHLSFLCRPLFRDSEPPTHQLETLNMGWFDEQSLPPLDRGHQVWVPNAFRTWRGKAPGAYFDGGAP